ncbi:hypothetical protein C823_002080 [Eubacterium plexicaudatum ASF492]|uniref:Uncharacterized protein n=1 Tax=Eubacterium plexicaudatum ASF492 TaxID=1235802 RepID=N2BGE0_9FIRM|nr:hypothetical protein C823_002080 [Eubacterium plexicaudatum ASF492]
MAGISNRILQMAGKAKPLLVKLLPLSLLRKIRSIMVDKNFQRLAATMLPYESGHYEKGVNLIGNIRLEAGLGQSCRLVASALERTEIPFGIYQYAPSGADHNGDHTWDEHIRTTLPYNVNLIHINPLELGTAYCQIDRQTWDYRYHIAFWLWELEDFPEEWTKYFTCLNEIWAPSEFTCNAIRKKTSLPVKCMPYYLEADIRKEYTREDFKLPEGKFLFLMMYDSYSCAERKNPAAVMYAYQKAFGKTNMQTGLVIKINHATKEDEARIQNEMDGYPNVYLIRDLLDRNAVNNLIRCVDVIVSLHRTEGFGLVLAEAMLLGTPVIATNWSANTEFMNKETACMVDYRLCTLEQELPPFHAGSRWADPDIRQAAAYMKKLYEDRAYYQKISSAAKAHIRQTLSIERASARMKERLEEIYRELENDEKDSDH